ncbi:helix-turn-helix domain-containing protein [Duganella sp. P38]|uniref:helix-turn-helix domain-containing protein n=1 Tax=Duganella sp. P38 TaxID=3423949 RepID=UPI003D7C0FD8
MKKNGVPLNKSGGHWHKKLESAVQVTWKYMGKAYGDTIGGYFRATQQPLFVQSAAMESDVAVTYLRSEGGGTGVTAPIPPEPAILLAIQLQPLREHRLWLDGVDMAVKPYDAGALTMLDLRARPVADLASSYECVQMYFPHAAMDALSDADDAPRLGDLPLLNGATDPVLAHLAHIARAAVSPPGPASALFVESLFLTVHRHLRRQYAGIQTARPGGAGKLAAWQERCAKEYMEAHLAQNITLAEMAALCKLSVSWFGRAFKATTGVSPYQWLSARRIERAKRLLMADTKIVEIALQCGFADQSHLSREFRRAVGASPAAWRQAVCKKR